MNYRIVAVGSGGRASTTVSASTLAPVLHIKADETSGTVAADSSGNGLNATLSNGPTFVSSGRSAGGNALNFDGVNDYGTVADSALLDGTNKLTVSLWFKADSIDNDPHGLAAKRVHFDDKNSWSLLLRYGGGLFVDFDGSVNRLQSNTVIEAGKWYHVAAVFDGTLTASQRVKLYINGTLDSTGTNPSSTIPDFASDLYIGSLEPGYSPFDGAIDDLRVYRTALTAQQVLETAEIPVTPTGLTAALHTGSFRKVDLTWPDAASNEVGYRIERQYGASGAWTTLATLAAGSQALFQPVMELRSGTVISTFVPPRYPAVT